MEVNYFTILYWFLPYINMNAPWVYTCSPSWTPLPPPSPYHPSGSCQCTSPQASCILHRTWAGDSFLIWYYTCFIFLKFYFIFKLYIIVLVLPNIKMNPPQVYMCSPSWTLLPPPSPYHPSGSSQCTSPKHLVSCMEPGLAICFIYDIIHVSMPFSQIIPPSPSPTESKRIFYKSVSLLLPRIQGCCYHLSKFHIYALVYCIGVFLSGLLHSV